MKRAGHCNKNLTIIDAIIGAFVSKAQITKGENDLALQLVRNNSAAIGLSKEDINNLFVSSTYQTSSGGIRMIYLQQSFREIPVFNQMQVLAFKNDKLVSVSGSRIQGIEKKVNINNGVPVRAAKEAVLAALTDRRLISPEIISPLRENGRKTEFGTLRVSAKNITAELVWLPVNGKEVKLTWQVELVPNNSSDHWLIRVDAKNNIVLDKNNLTVYDQWDGSANITATGKYQTDFRKNTINNEEDNYQNNLRPFVVNSATYRVIPYPAESPNHPGISLFNQYVY